MGKNKFTVRLLVPKSDQGMKELIERVMEMAKKVFPAKQFKDVTAIPRTPIRDGDESPEIKGFAGHYIISARSKNRPGIVGPDRKPLATPEECIYPGAWARISVGVGAFDVDGSKGVNLILGNVQWIRHDEPFTGGVAAEDEFGEVDGGDASSSYGEPGSASDNF
jgi:hypothetical protein